MDRSIWIVPEMEDGKMGTPIREFLLTGTAVLIYCLVVSFGPGLLFNGASNADRERNSTQVRMVEQLN
jgi:hypothetical protein